MCIMLFTSASLVCNNPLNGTVFSCYQNQTSTKSTITHYICAIVSNKVICENKFNIHECNFDYENNLYDCIKYYTINRYILLCFYGYILSYVISLFPKDVIIIFFQILVSKMILDLF